MKAEIISTGNELLEGKVRERNASVAASGLWQIGLSVDRIVVVSDGLESIRQAVAEALLRSDVVIVSGGLGPTEDDRTAEAVATATGLKLELDERGVGELKKRFEALGLSWTENQARQMRFPQGARPIANPRGTAPGFELEHGGRWIFCMPGPPGEFKPMFTGPVLERLRGIAASAGAAAESLVLRAFGVGEGHLQDMLR
ncbi:MAG: competence/damage-inducible protein A, partial [Deltaproteobacteria bacterium]